VSAAAQNDEVTSIGTYEAKTRLSELVDQVLNGASVLITRHGRPQVALVGIAKSEQQRRRNLDGFMKEQLKGLSFPDDFDTLMADEITAMFAGRYSGPLPEVD